MTKVDCRVAWLPGPRNLKESGLNQVLVLAGQRSRCAILNGGVACIGATLSYMTTPHRTELQRLMLQTQRDLVAKMQLITLLTIAEKAVADDRQQLRAVKALIKRAHH